MTFYYEKFRELRKSKKIKISYLIERLDITRSTLWFWENGKVAPSEKKIRALANLISTDISIISDLKAEYEKSPDELSKHKELISSWITSTDCELKAKEDKNYTCLAYLKNQVKESFQAISLLKHLLNSSEAMIYIKDVNNRFIAASKNFLNEHNVQDEKNIQGKDDFFIFNKSEGKFNQEEDEFIIKNGKGILNKEGIIPGTRKKRWGIISKKPIFDYSGKIAGIIASMVDITDRKKNETLIDGFKNALGMIDEAIWIGKNPRVKEDGRIAIDKFLYSIDNKLRKALLIDNKNLSTEELWNYADSLIVEEDKIKKIKWNELFTQNKTEIRLKLEPNKNKAIYVKIRIYYDSETEIFVFLATEDSDRIAIESIKNNLLKLGVEKHIIKEAVDNVLKY